MKIYDFVVKDIRKEEVSLSQYEGKVILVVNSATKCGLTPQYEGLQKIYDKYNVDGFEILDFPSNQFLEQAPGSDEEINNFCTLNYFTTFPRFSKIDVNGENADPLYKWLKKEKPEDISNDKAKEFEKEVKQYTPNNKPEDIKWNFGKFLIDRKGNVVERFSPAITPESLAEEIEKLL